VNILFLFSGLITGELMYEKFVAFTLTLDDLGKSIDKTQQSYHAALNQLSVGNGNLVDQAIKMKQLGLKSSKEIPSKILSLQTEN
jgi:DNA recombination protein RmuC